MFEPHLTDGDCELLTIIKTAALRRFARAVAQLQRDAIIDCAGVDGATADRCVALIKRLRQDARGIGPATTLPSVEPKRG